MSNAASVSELVIRGKMKLIEAEVRNALDAGETPMALLNAMIDAMGVVGEKFKSGEMFIPEMMVAARAMKKGVEVLKPLLGSGAAGANGKVIIGTVSGDLHDIGKNLVAMMIESAGFEVIDLGVDVSAEKFIETYKANPDTRIIALSTLLTTTMAAMKETVERLTAEGIADRVRIMVGGAPITAEFAAQIGADAYTADAAAAADRARELSV